MDINNKSNLHCISFSILKVLLPSLSQTDITNVRIVKSNNPHTTVARFPSFIISLISHDLVLSIVRAKKSFNYLTTRNIDLSLLNSQVASALPDKKIFVNEVLSTNERVKYISIKDTAKSLGFKFVWYCSGQFLVRWREGMRSFAVESISDLTTIVHSQKTIHPTQDALPYTNTTNLLSQILGNQHHKNS